MYDSGCKCICHLVQSPGQFNCLFLHTAPFQCPAGFMCEKKKMMSCDSTRKIPVNAYGDFHASSYCPERSSGLGYCPIGKYCNMTNMTAAMPCPSGFFCPLMTEVPNMRCLRDHVPIFALFGNFYRRTALTQGRLAFQHCLRKKPREKGRSAGI